MSATIRLEVHTDDDFNPHSVWHNRKTIYTYIYADVDEIIEALGTMEGGSLTDSEFEDIWTFDCDPSLLSKTLDEVGMGDVMPELPDGHYTGFTVDILY